jgi:hypothetical protein
MRNHFWTAILAACIAVTVGACKSDDATSVVTGEGKITGTVTDKTTSTALAGVGITAQSLSAGTQQVTTGAAGDFTFSFTIDSTSSVVLTFSKTGWRDTTIVYALRSGTITTANVVMTPKSVVNPGGGSGLAQTIAFLGAVPTEISVRGVGGTETSLLSWEVRDSLGLPIDIAHSVSLTVSVQNGPGGGEYITPSPIATNANGQAYTTLTSGTRSGAVQVVASATVQTPGGPRVVTTAPVRIVINGGFPDQAHFTIATRAYNLPILGTSQVPTPISVLVGDRYSNPVLAGTAVYFRSSAGVIQAKVATDGVGQGTVSFFSGNPTPFGVYAANPPGDAYHYIVGETFGQAGVRVTDSILVLWSGRAQISAFTPTTFNILNGGSQPFTFTVSDFLGHPLSEGTTISVSASPPQPSFPGAPVNQVQLRFDQGANGAATLRDIITPGAGSTLFSFTLSDGSQDIRDTLGARVTVSVSVSGPNGLATFSTDGLVH